MPPTKLRIDNPCTESWDAMSLQAEGRHCTSCQKIVQDFTQFSDPELVAWFEQSSGRTCGRLRIDQVNKVLRVNTAERSGSSWLRWVVALVVGWQSVKGQSTPPEPKLTPAKPAAMVAPSTPASQQARQQATDNDPVVFTMNGRVTDILGVPIQGANLLFKTTTRGCITDHAGYFQLAVRESDRLRKTRKLMVSFIGYKTVETPVSTKRPSKQLTIQLVEDYTVLGEVACISDKKRKHFAQYLTKLW